jgi:small-conductance mechanosensitive channel
MTQVVVVVGVAYGSDVDRALELMRTAAQALRNASETR